MRDGLRCHTNIMRINKYRDDPSCQSWPAPATQPSAFSQSVSGHSPWRNLSWQLGSTEGHQLLYTLSQPHEHARCLTLYMSGRPTNAASAGCVKRAASTSIVLMFSMPEMSQVPRPTPPSDESTSTVVVAASCSTLASLCCPQNISS
jgi:hypothetical protein